MTLFVKQFLVLGVHSSIRVKGKRKKFLLINIPIYY